MIQYNVFELGRLLTGEEIKVLEGLGLTSCQSRVYLALCHFGVLDAKTVSKYSGVPRQDVYRVTADLEGLGLIEKVISSPTSFNAIPVDKGSSILLRRRKEETGMLESKTRVLFENFKTNNKEMHVTKPEFVFVPGKEAYAERAKKLIEQGFKYETGEYDDGGKLFSKYK